MIIGQANNINNELGSEDHQLLSHANWMADTKPTNATHAEWVVVNMLELPKASKTMGVIVGAVV